MPVACLFIKLAAAPLAVNSVVKWLTCYLTWVEVLRAGVGITVAHSLSKLQTLQFPLGHFAGLLTTLLLWRLNLLSNRFLSPSVFIF